MILLEFTVLSTAPESSDPCGQALKHRVHTFAETDVVRILEAYDGGEGAVALVPDARDADLLNFPAGLASCEKWLPRKEQTAPSIPFVAQNRRETPVSLRRKEDTPGAVPFVEKTALPLGVGNDYDVQMNVGRHMLVYGIVELSILLFNKR